MLHTDAGGVCARQPTVSPLAQDMVCFHRRVGVACPAFSPVPMWMMDTCTELPSSTAHRFTASFPR